MNKDNGKKVLSATLCLVTICLIVTLLVAGTRYVFADRITAQEWKTTQDTMSKLIKADKYEEVKVKGDSSCYKAMDSSGKVVGYLFETAAYGYGGDVSVMTAISDGKVSGISVLDCSSETPGLGQNSTKPSFTNQFKGLTKAPEVTKSSPKDNQVEAMTGATRTTNAVAGAVSEAFELYGTVADAK